MSLLSSNRNRKNRPCLERNVQASSAPASDQIKQRQEAIRHAALVLFQKNGLENVSLNDIAKKVGTAKRDDGDSSRRR
jgi:Bacterial regulatory proteins, tetR family